MKSLSLIAGRTAPFDAVIVGSGAGGGMAAHVLSQAGLKVCLLEAGRAYDPAKETPMFNLNRDAPLRGEATPDKPFGYYDATVAGGWEIPGEPYSVEKGTDFRWWRARMLGGRTNHWGRVALRFASHDLCGFTRDGLGFDWPINYSELGSYYDGVERLIGVFGSNDDLVDAPNSPDGVLHSPPPPRIHERVIIEAGRRLGKRVVANRAAILTHALPGRRACFYATPCSRGCSIGAAFQSPTALLKPALATGNLTIITNAMVHAVTTDRTGRVRGVGYMDKLTGSTKSIDAQHVMLAASAVESVRILFNSTTNLFPNGLGQHSGALGKGLFDTNSTIVVGQLPILESLPPHNDFGAAVAHSYIPWWGFDSPAKPQLDFPRGYHLEILGGRNEPNDTYFKGLSLMSNAESGSALKEDARRYFGSFIALRSYGETLYNEGSFVEIDSEKKDRWGIPVPKFTFTFGDHEARQRRHAVESITQLFEAVGGRAIRPPLHSRGGEVIHEVGGARMSATPETGVLDPHARVWHIPNLYVIDGAAFPSSPHKNPTLTILALACRAANHVLQQGVLT